ncbi:hypothetical protein [Paenisporosarcina sp. TG20]|uniref:hypothetical protein n=1 Tax=Paenisporosarcina sp. TG20 TaxID=1211706 RepID=UPI0002D8CDC3|nr:hypothetical protein [Paenisporosarcina sp. TG20]
MDQEINKTGLLDSIKLKETKESSFNKVLLEVEKETTNMVLTTQFPEWDLKPPTSLIKRKSTKLL